MPFQASDSQTSTGTESTLILPYESGLGSWCPTPQSELQIAGDGLQVSGRETLGRASLGMGLWARTYHPGAVCHELLRLPHQIHALKPSPPACLCLETVPLIKYLRSNEVIGMGLWSDRVWPCKKRWQRAHSLSASLGAHRRKAT